MPGIVIIIILCVGVDNTNLHDGTGQEQHEAPLRDEKHLKSKK